MKEPLFLIIDLFCGAGGTTTGFHLAEIDVSGIAQVFACVNHDPKAIKSHWLNHPEVKHFEEDIRTLDLTELVAMTKTVRVKYPNAKLVLWASLECTNFSKAKGGQPRNADSRTLADHLPRYITALDPDYIKIENVVEFMSWGPLDAKGKPVSRKSGEDWLRWRENINSLGYRDEWKELNSANFGAYTSRNRLFGVFAKDDAPIAWPEPTHAKKPSVGMHGSLKKWMPVKDVLNFEDEGESILVREKPLVDATLERIYAGLIKFVAMGDTSFLSKYFSGKPSDKNISTDGPAGTIKTKDGQALVQADFLVKYNSKSRKGHYVPPSIEDPAPTIGCQRTPSFVRPEFLTHYYSGGGQTSGVDDPCPTVTAMDGKALIQAERFLEKQFGKSQNQSINDPAGTVMPNDKHRLVTAEPFLIPTNYSNGPKSIDEPSPTITANRKHHYLINPSWGGHPGSVENPCCVIIARQDKAPLYFVQVEKGPVSVAVYDTDSPSMIKIKQFMAAYGIVDIKMRMLRVVELLRIQGFPQNYKMVGNQADHKKFIGNSVHPLIPKYWAEAMAEKLLEFNQKVA